MPDSFFDTNVLLYLAGPDVAKAQRTKALIGTGGVISVQVLNEIANLTHRKWRVDWARTHALLAALRNVLVIRPLTVQVHDAGLALAERHQLSIYDSMIVASALDAGCTSLWSEDMHDGLLIEGRLQVRNPFRPGP
jgi:predicted nucleic acid-binding protein